jgi:hypothetical protein
VAAELSLPPPARLPAWQQGLGLAGWLAASFVARLLEIADKLPARFGVLSRRPAMAAEIRRAWRAGEYHRALATYLKAQIGEELAALATLAALAARPPRARL